MDPQLHTGHRRSALFLNALVMPGCGHFVLGMRAKGTAIVILTILFLFVPIFRFLMALLEALARIPMATGALPRAIHALALAWAAERSLILWCLVGIIVVWLYGILDLYLLKRNAPHDEGDRR